MSEERKHSHYFRPFPYENIDIYRFLEVFDVTCPVAQHIIKKAVATGKRGYKDLQRDWQDIVDSAQRKLEMLSEEANTPKKPEVHWFDATEEQLGQAAVTLAQQESPWYPSEPAGLEWKETQWDCPAELSDEDEVYVLYRYEREDKYIASKIAEYVNYLNWDDDGSSFDIVAYAVKKD